MKKIFCDFRKQGNDNYCDILADIESLPDLISDSIDEYFTRLKNNKKELFSYSKIEKCNIFNLPVNFDIETTNIAETKSALCYIWQIAIYETVFYGRFIDDFSKFIDLLDTILTSIQIPGTKAKNGVIIYVHNLSFEYQFIRKYFKLIPDSFLNYDKRDIIKFEIQEFSRIIFRCSYQLTRKPLRKLNNSRNIVKLTPIDYSLYRSPVTQLTKQELDYAVFDVLVMSYYFDDKIISEGKNLTEIPYTLTGYAREYFKIQCGFKLSKKDVIPDNVLAYRKVLANCTLPTQKDLQIARYCFQGGFTHGGIAAYNDIHENVYHYDITSSYPTVLLSEMYPVTAFTHTTAKTDALYTAHDDFVFKIVNMPVHEVHGKLKLGYIICVKLNEVKLRTGKPDAIISYSKILNKDSENNKAVIHKILNGRVQAGDNIELFITDVDYELIKMFYEFKPIILDIYFAQFDYLPEVFCKTIADLYKNKTVLKDVSGKEYEYALLKIILNSIYGLNVTDPVPDDFTYNNDKKELQQNKITKEIIQEKLNEYNAVRDKPNKINFYYWGVFCTAYARYNLINMINKLGLDYLYADTDSVFFTGEHNIRHIEEYNFEIVQKLMKNPSVSYEQISPKDVKDKVHILGQWTKERFCNKFVTIGAKRYLEIYPCNFKFTCAGIKPANIKKFFEKMWREYFTKHYHFTKLSEYRKFNYFDQKHTFIAERFNDVYNGTDYLITDSGKQTSHFNDETVTGVITDYQNHQYQYTVRSSLYLENTSFNLTMFDISDAIVSLIDQYKILKKSGVIDNELL